ncbi:helix-turn-helix transcriptional regulator [Nocardia nova]|nr:helix-turn-helix transcriptional regulator [Nocardia nova]MDN2495851.1 helix-turn-helix transcriptional regulator [Nocardia nova]
MDNLTPTTASARYVVRGRAASPAPRSDFPAPIGPDPICVWRYRSTPAGSPGKYDRCTRNESDPARRYDIRLVRAAGLPRGALYHHFDDRKDLFDAVIEVWNTTRPNAFERR